MSGLQGYRIDADHAFVITFAKSGFWITKFWICEVESVLDPKKIFI
jgi:hypothetical protein